MNTYITSVLFTFIITTASMSAASAKPPRSRLIGPEEIQRLTQLGILPDFEEFKNPAEIRFDHSIEEEIELREGALEDLVWNNFPKHVFILASLEDLNSIAKCDEIRNNVRFLSVNGPLGAGPVFNPKKVFAALAEFPSLEIVEIRSMQPFGPEIAILSKCSKLQSLEIRVYKSMRVPKELYMLNLKGLYLIDSGANSIEFPEGISLMKNLRLLQCEYFSKVSFPKDLKSMRLDGVVIRGCGIGDEIYDVLPEELKWLDLSETKVTEFVPWRLTKNLEELYLYGCQIKELPDPLLVLRNLRIINLANNRIRMIPSIRPERRFGWEIYLNGNPIKKVSEEAINYIFGPSYSRVFVDRIIMERLLDLKTK